MDAKNPEHPDEVVHEAMSDATQKTQPRGIDPKTGKPYEPVEIPVPKRGEFAEVFKRAAGTNAPEPAKKSRTRD